MSKDYTANAEAYRLFLKGRFEVFKLTRPEVEQGILDFQQAINLDQNYALAYVGLSEGNRSLALANEANAAEYLPKAIQAAQKALSLDDSLAEAHTAFATSIFWYDRNFREAESQFKRALELNPKTIDAHLFYAHLLSNIGRHAEAIEEIKRARELDPYNPLIGALMGQFLIHAGRSDEALVTLKETYAIAPRFWFPHVFAAKAYITKGMYAEAVNEAHRAQELSGWQTVSLAYEGVALAKWGKRDEAKAALDKLISLSQEKNRWIPPYHFALINIALGNKEEAFSWLQKGIEEHDPKIAFTKVDPAWNSVQDDPGFQEILRRAGF
jgi:serine/threonine-protein kinase